MYTAYGAKPRADVVWPTVLGLERGPSFAEMNEARPLPGVQRAYFYLVALVAVHMVVLAVANLLRVAGEIAFQAPPGGFTGLPFIFADLNHPNDVYRQQASLAVALLVVGLPAWLIHFGYAQRIARRAPEDRASTWRSFHLHLVIFVTALLVFGYGARAVGLVLEGLVFGGAPFPRFSFPLEAEWGARAWGAAAMALTAAAALAYHVFVSSSDRHATLVTGNAAKLRHLALYVLALIGLFTAAVTVVSALGEIWAYVTENVTIVRGNPVAVSGPTREDFLRFQLVGAIPGTLASLALWLGTWIPLQRGVRAATPDGEVERASTVRKLAIYIVVFASAVTVLGSFAFVLTSIGRRLLGDPIRDGSGSVQSEVGTPLIAAVVFGAIWIFYRRVVAVEAAREAEQERAANIRRLYTYLIAAVGMAMLAFGLAGAIGVVGSIVMGINTHSHTETATYVSLVVIGLPAWALSWWQARARLDDAERRSLPRRGYLYLAVFGGVVALLVFGSAVLYRLLNATLAGSFGLPLWHDVWHLTVDAAVSTGAFLLHFRVVRADRTGQAPIAAAPAEHPVTVLVRAIDAAAARARITAVLEGQPDISIR